MAALNSRIFGTGGEGRGAGGGGGEGEGRRGGWKRRRMNEERGAGTGAERRGRQRQSRFRLKSILFQRTELATPLLPFFSPFLPFPLAQARRARSRAHARTHARIFVNNIRGNLIIFLLPRFNSERFFRFASPPIPPARARARSLSLSLTPAFVARSVVCGSMFLRGVRSDWSASARPVGWEMKGRPFSRACVHVRT